MSTNNKAIVCKIYTYSHPNADRVQLGRALDFQVVVGKEIKDGELGVYFPENVCLSQEFAKAHPGLMEYFPKNRRVRTQKFRGQISDGFWIPIHHLDFVKELEPHVKLGLTEGDYFDSLGGISICYKYVNPHQMKRGTLQGRKGQRKGSFPTFQKHVDTQQWQMHQEKIKENDKVIITSKLHGTSQRCAYALVERKKLSLIEKLAGFFGAKIQKKEYTFLIGTRNVILRDQQTNEGQVVSFREKAAEPFRNRLHKGEVIYYEVVGWEDYDVPIMGKVDINEKDKDLRGLYGKNVIYKYGCRNGEHDIYVYRIAYQNEDGNSVDLSWEQVKERCKELGVKHVPEIEAEEEAFYLPDLIKTLTEDGPDDIDPSHPFEGIVLRVEGISPRFYKHKTEAFKYLEGIIKERIDFFDPEDER